MGMMSQFHILRLAGKSYAVITNYLTFSNRYKTYFPGLRLEVLHLPVIQCMILQRYSPPFRYRPAQCQGGS